MNIVSDKDTRMQTNQEKMPEQIVTRNRLMIVEDASIVAMDLSCQLEEMATKFVPWWITAKMPFSPPRKRCRT